MNDPEVEKLMTSVRKWLAMDTESAKKEILSHMDNEGVYQKLDYDFVNLSETAEEAIGLVFGV